MKIKKTKKKVHLKNNQWHKHNYVRTFFRINLEKVEDLYKQLNGSLDLNPKKWHRFVNSKELFDLIYPLMSTISEFTLEAIAYSEPIEWLGDEMRTGDFEIYHAMPFELHDNIQRPNIRFGVLQHATRCFITMLSHMFFKHLYQKPFMILRGIQGTGSAWVYLNNDLEYCYIE